MRSRISPSKTKGLEKLFLAVSDFIDKKGEELGALKSDVAAIGPNVTEQSALASRLSGRVFSLEMQLREMAERPAPDLHEFAAGHYDGAKLMSAVFAGRLKDDTQYSRGLLYQWSGGVYLCLKDGRGQMPSKRTLEGDDPTWALFSGRGAPGPVGPIGPAGPVSDLVPFPASPTAAGTKWDMSYQNGFLAVCVQPNTWRFAALSDTYPF